MKHEIPAWVDILIYAFPIFLIVAVWVFMIIRVKKRGAQKVIEETFSPKRMIRSLMLWIGVALVLVLVFNLMQAMQH